MTTLSLLLNIIVLIPVCSMLLMDNERVRKVAGIFTPARGILLAMYMTIALASAVLLFINEPKFVVALLAIQIIYKLISPFTVKTFKNPIVISNLFIALFHLITLFTLYNSGELSV